MKKRIVSILLCLVMCLSVIPINAFAGAPVDSELYQWQQEKIKNRFQPILDDPSASDEMKAIAREAIEKILETETEKEYDQVDEKYDEMLKNQALKEEYIHEHFDEYLASDETKDLAQEYVDKIQATDDWEEIFLIWEEYEQTLQLPEDIEGAIAFLTEEYLNSDEYSEETKAVVQDFINQFKAVTTVEEFDELCEKFDLVMDLQEEKDESIAFLTEHYLNSDEYSDEIKTLMQNFINEIKTVTTMEELEALDEKFSSMMELQEDKEEAIAFLTEHYLNSDEYSDETKALVRDTINEIKTVTTMEEYEALEEKFSSMMELQEAKEEAIASASGVLTSDEESDEMKALAQKFIDEVKATTSVEDINALWEQYDPLIELQYAKDDARKEVKELLPEDASNAVKKIVSDACTEIQANDDPDQYAAIIEAAKKAVEAQLQKEEQLAPAKADAIAEINAAKTGANAGVVKAAIAAINDAQSEEEISTLKTQTLADMAKVDALIAPTLSIAKADGKIKLSWNAVSGANKYWIYRSTDGNNYSYYDSTTKTSYTNSSVTSGTKYYYKVKAVVTINGANYASAYSAAKSIIPMTTPTVTLTATADGVTVKWNKITGATNYQVWRKTGTSSTAKWTLIKTAASSDTSYTNAGLTGGTKYQYKVRAVIKDGSTIVSTSDYAAIKTKYFVAQPKISSITNTSTGITVKWGKITGATGYKVYRKMGSGDWKLLKTVTGTSYTNTGLTNGTKYQYKIVAVKKVGTTNYTGAASAIKTMYRLTRPAISSATNVATRKITVKWNKNTKATGYQVKYVVGSTTKTVKVTSASTLSKTLSSLTKGSTYKVYVRSYKTVSGTTYYSAYSAVKSVKVAK